MSQGLLFTPTLEQLDRRPQGAVLHLQGQSWRAQGWYQGRLWGRRASSVGKDLDDVLVEIPRSAWASRLRPPEER